MVILVAAASSTGKSPHFPCPAVKGYVYVCKFTFELTF